MRRPFGLIEVPECFYPWLAAGQVIVYLRERIERAGSGEKVVGARGFEPPTP